jgi:Uma2 family endonuclease
MTTAVTTQSDLGRLPPLPTGRLTVEDYHRMIESGVLHADHRVELLEGRIVPKMPHNPPHGGMIDVLVGEFHILLPADWFTRVQSAITTPDSEPEPDVAVVRGPRKRYFAKHPQTPDIGMVVEVSDSTLQQDRNVKNIVYGRAGIAIYWIVNLPDARVEVHTEPFDGGYKTLRSYGAGDSIPLILEGQLIGTISVAALFGI